MVVLFVDLELSELVTVLLLHVFHLSQHHELFLIDNIFSFVAEFVVTSNLLGLEALAAFILLTVQLCLKFVNIVFGSV